MVRATRSGVKAEVTGERPSKSSPTAHETSATSDTMLNQTVDVNTNMQDSIDTSGMADDTTLADDNTSTQAKDPMHLFADHSRQLIQAIQKLEALRIDAALPTLPKFVVVGDQSHGKSSIVEALCDIKLPRAAGTCTRCPFMITTTPSSDSESWRCEVTLVHRYHYNPKIKSLWEDSHEQRHTHFATVQDKDDLEKLLRLAQLAILNEKIPVDDIREGRVKPGDGVKFSLNFVKLEISAPHLLNLALYDLPGAINVHPDESEQRLVPVIEKMIRSYLIEGRTLVLLAISANQDVECSTAYRYIRACKASDRTMGVLTKPDLVTNAQIPQIIDLLHGERFKLGGGWFTTKHLSQEEINAGYSHAQAEEFEVAFFQSDPWRSALAPYPNRFGIHSLREAMAAKLREHILAHLPEINRGVDARYNELQRELDGFPPQSAAPCLTVMSDIDTLTERVVSQIKGESLKNEFRKQYREIFGHFVSTLANTKPKIVLNSPEQAPIAVDSDEDTDGADSSTDTSPTKKSKGPDGRPTAAPQSRPGEVPRNRRTPVKRESTAILEPPKNIVFTLTTIRQAYTDGCVSTLPDHNWKVTNDLITQTVASWGDIVEGMIQLIHTLVLRMLSKSITDTLATRLETKLYSQTKKAVGEFFVLLMDEQTASIRNYITCEKHTPNSFQKTTLGEKLAAVTKKLKDGRADIRATEYADNREIKLPTKPEDRKKKVADILAKLGPDEYEKDIESIAKVLAYYDLASARVPDVIAITLEYGLLHRLQDGLKHKLREELRVMDTEYCLELLAEDPKRELRRRELLAEQQKLKMAMEELHKLSLD